MNNGSKVWIYKCFCSAILLKKSYENLNYEHECWYDYELECECFAHFFFFTQPYVL